MPVLVIDREFRVVEEVYGWRGDESGKGAFWTEQKPSKFRGDKNNQLEGVESLAIYKTLVVVEYEVRKRWFGVILQIILFRNLYVTLQMKGGFWNQRRHDQGCGV